MKTIKQGKTIIIDTSDPSILSDGTLRVKIQRCLDKKDPSKLGKNTVKVNRIVKK